VCLNIEMLFANMIECIILSTGLHCWPRVCYKWEWSVAVHCLTGVLNIVYADKTALYCAVLLEQSLFVKGKAYSTKEK